MVLASISSAPSLMRVGMPVSLLMLIQKPSVSMRPPLGVVSATRMLDQRVDIDEHHRRMCTWSGKWMGSKTSMTVRRTIHIGSVLPREVASRLSVPTSCR
ncbi:hypothetical protein ASG84_01560 [Rhodococcus sp. Leaf278]|nr:hypothetical protein ASG84_01560 [Rhodococcus sp. Leaf278]